MVLIYCLISLAITVVIAGNFGMVYGVFIIWRYAGPIIGIPYTFLTVFALISEALLLTLAAKDLKGNGI